MHFEGSKDFSKWIHGVYIHKIYSASDPGTKEMRPIQEMATVAQRRALVDKCKQAEQEEDKATSDAQQKDIAEEDKTEEAAEEDKEEEATVKVAKTISASGGKCAKKYSLHLNRSNQMSQLERKQ